MDTATQTTTNSRFNDHRGYKPGGVAHPLTLAPMDSRALPLVSGDCTVRCCCCRVDTKSMATRPSTAPAKRTSLPPAVTRQDSSASFRGTLSQGDFGATVTSNQVSMNSVDLLRQQSKFANSLMSAVSPNGTAQRGTSELVVPAGGASAVSVTPGADRYAQMRDKIAALSSTVEDFSAGQPRRSGPGHAMLSVPDDRWREVREHVVKMEQHLALEVRRRAEADRDTQLLLEARCQEITEALERKVADRLAHSHHAVDALTKKVDKLTTELALEREKNIRLTQELRQQSQQGLADVKAVVEQERKQRSEREILLKKKLQEDTFRLQERIDVERHAREVMTAALQEDIGKAAQVRHKADEKLLAQLREDILSLGARVRQEHDLLERAEETLASNLNDVVEQVSLALRAL